MQAIKYLIFSFTILNCAEDDISAKCEWPDSEQENSEVISPASSSCSDSKFDRETLTINIPNDDESEEFGPFVSATEPTITPSKQANTTGFLAFLALFCSWLCCKNRFF